MWKIGIDIHHVIALRIYSISFGTHQLFPLTERITFPNCNSNRTRSRGVRLSYHTKNFTITLLPSLSGLSYSTISASTTSLLIILFNTNWDRCLISDTSCHPNKTLVCNVPMCSFDVASSYSSTFSFCHRRHLFYRRHFHFDLGTMTCSSDPLDECQTKERALGPLQTRTKRSTSNFGTQRNVAEC